MGTTIAHITQLLSAEGLLAGDAAAPEAALAPEVLATPLTGASCDSRAVKPGHIFICKGVAFKPAYLASAVSTGAVCYLAPAEWAAELGKVAPGVPALIVNDVRRAMSLVSAEAWGHPDRELSVIGITGTKGKSTVTYMLRAILEGADEGAAAYERCGIIGSIETYDGVERAESHNTTPEAPDLWRHLANAQVSGLEHMIMEVSSQGLKYGRVEGLELSVGCFLNIGTDHISPAEHPSFEDYFASKLRIFEQTKVGVVNLDTDHLSEVMAAASVCERVLTFSATRSDADVWASDVDCGFGIVSFKCHTPTWTGRVAMPMPGLFNVDNALAAICIAEHLGCTHDEIVQALYNVRIPGRMELLLTPDRKVVGLVDYAHNVLAYQRLFPSLRREFEGFDIICVLGAVGDKALERRRDLPPEAAKYCSRLIFTSNHPGHERPEDICAEMEAATPAGTPCETHVERRDAIARAVELAYSAPGSTLVVMLSKGDEEFQHIGDAFVPCEPDSELFDDAVRRFGPRVE